MQTSSLTARIEAELTERLNDVQRAAVLHDRGPLLIVAGAGSGKTRVITHRIAYLARIRNVRPWNICAVTFTNKAAGEMRERLGGLLGPMGGNVFVRTFHSLGLYVLSRHPELAGLKSGFTIIDQAAQISLLKRLLKDKRVDPARLSAQAVANVINRLRDDYVSPATPGARRDPFAAEMSEIYVEYARRLRAANSLDFADLLYETVRIFHEHPETLAHYQDLWQYLMIDEYQDTNRVQYLLGRLVAQARENIMVVGDDDQSIYSWRGADISNILSFNRDYPSAKILRLEENYRSTPVILRAASSIIANNKERHPKTLFTRREAGEPARLAVYEDETDEAASVVSRIQSLHSQGVSYRDCAIFYRTNAQSRVFEKALREQGLPYVLVGDIRFYERKEIKDMIAYLSVIINPADELALERIINAPARGVGETGFAKLVNLARSHNITLLEALSHSHELPNFRAHKQVLELQRKFAAWRAMFEAGQPPSKIAEAALRESGYLEALQKESGHENEGRIENLMEFVAGLQRYEQDYAESAAAAYDPDQDPAQYDPETAGPRAGAPNLADYLQRISLYTSDTETTAEDACVYLMTLHNAKGLEFPNVFITGVEEGYMPHSLALEEGGLEEERRLMYVGLTRAEERLFLSTCRRRFVFGGFQDRLPSRFLKEMDPDVFESGAAPTAVRRPTATPRAGAGANQIQWKSSPAAALTFAPGDRIRHAKYGPGRITEAEKAPAGQKVTIRFDADGQARKFLTAYTPLTLLDP